MPIGLIGALIVLALVVAGIWMTFNLLGVLVTLIIAALAGWIADKVVPGKLPYGWLGAMTAGLLGSWLGSLLIGPMGPTVARIPIIPAILGAIIIAFIVQFAMKRGLARRRV